MNHPVHRTRYILLYPVLYVVIILVVKMCNAEVLILSFLFFFQWLMLVTVTILYNLVFVIGRGVFWELNNAMPTIWWILDYASDGIYVVDTLVHAHEGKPTPNDHNNKQRPTALAYLFEIIGIYDAFELG